MTDSNKPDYVLTDRQKKFVAAAKRSGLGDNIYYTYSGRCMYGRSCPAVNVDYVDDFKGWKKYNTDQMGRGMVIYCS